MKLPAHILVCGNKYTIKKDPTSNGGSFDTYSRVIVIGTIDKHKTPAIFLHEITELVYALRNIRYIKQVSEPDNGDYLFVCNHEQFDLASEDIAAAIKGIRF